MDKLQETSLSRLFDTWNKYDLGMISAYRHKTPEGQDRDDNNIYWQNSNRKKSTDLGNDIRNAGYWYTQIMGGYPETDKKGNLINVKERSYFVVNKDMINDNARKAFEDFMFDMCKKYGQDSIYMNTKNYPSGLYNADRQPVDFGEGPMVGMNKLNTNSDQEYYSRVNNSKFSFEKGNNMQTESKFEQLVYKILQENGIDLKEWDDESELRYMSKHPFDHTGENEIIWTLSDIPMNKQLYQTIVKANILGEDDLKDEQGNLIPTCELDCKIEYEIEGYPYDEEMTVSKIYLEDWAKDKTNWIDITNMLPREYLDKVGDDLVKHGAVELYQQA